jgi:hypothetical protein
MMHVESVHNSSNGEVSVKEVVLIIGNSYRYVRSKWLVILLLFVLGALLGFGYSMYRKPLYTATTTFVLESGDGAGSLGQYAGLASMVGIDLGSVGGGGIFQGDNIIELYKSRNMIQKALLSVTDYKGKKKELIEWYIDFYELREKWSKKPALKGLHFNVQSPDKPNFSRLQDSVMGTIVEEINKKMLFVGKPDKKLSIIRVDVKSKNEFFSKAFNDLIVKTVNDFYIQTKTKKATENVSILASKTDSVRRVMNGSIYKIAAVADATPNLNPTRQVQRVVPMQRSQFSAETNKAILGELVKNLEMSKMALLKETPLIQVVDVPVYPLEIDKLSKFKAVVVGALALGFLSILWYAGKHMLSEMMR